MRAVRLTRQANRVTRHPERWGITVASSCPVAVGVENWSPSLRYWWPPLAFLLAVLLTGLGLAFGLGVVGGVFGGVWFAYSLANNRFIIVAAEVRDGVMEVTFLDERRRSLPLPGLRLGRRSAWRVAFFGGCPLLGYRRQRSFVGAFYPTIHWEDLEGLDIVLRRPQADDSPR